MSIYRQIYKKIKKYNNIVLAHHIGPDPDALGSTFGLKEVIFNTFPKKNVYVVGACPSKFRYIGISDKVDESIYEDSLLIVCDTPDIKRVDSVESFKFKESIKIDHHPFIEKYCDIEWIDPDACSVSQMIIELVYKTRLKMNKEAAAKLYMGVVGDTERFLHNYTTCKTFELVTKLLKDTKLDFTKLYEPMYLRPIKDLKFQGYIMNNITITDNGFGYIKITNAILEEYGVDSSTPGNLINNFGFIDEIIAWGFFTEDVTNENVKGSIRSRGPIINEVLAPYGGGGHKLAAGVRAKSFNMADEIISKLDEVCKEYNDNFNE